MNDFFNKHYFFLIPYTINLKNIVEKTENSETNLCIPGISNVIYVNRFKN